MESDSAQRSALAALLRANGFSTTASGSVPDLIAALDYIETGCVLLDLDLERDMLTRAYRALQNIRPDMLIIGMASSPTIREAVRAIRSGAMDVIERPLSEALLMQMMEQVAAKLPSHAEQARRAHQARDAVASLTSREREVLERLLNGLSNKMIASELSITVRTTEMHRAHIMSKFGTKSLASLTRMALRAGFGEASAKDAAA